MEAQQSSSIPRRGRFSSAWQKVKLINLDPEKVFQRTRPPPTARSVFVNLPLPDEAFDQKGKPTPTWQFANNQVLTAKYTVYNFLFKNLLEQFRRVANLFFLLITVLQFFPQFTTISPGVAMLPLLAVLAITMVKDGYEDFKRHQSDRLINKLKVRIVAAGHWKNPNAMTSKSRSLTATLRAIQSNFFGAKKRQSKQVLQERRERASMTPNDGPLEPPATPRQPPADAPGGRASQRVPLLQVPLSRQVTQRSVATHHSVCESEYEHLNDGRIMHQGRILGEEEEKRYHAKRAPRWKSKVWEDLAVGDFVYLKNNDAIPADIIICSTSEDEDICYLETKNLDGETNLKARHAVPELSHLRSPQDCVDASFRVDAEPQDTNMYRLNASVIFNDRFDKKQNPLQCPVTLNQVLLRGCQLRNTKWVVGIVLMTGVDTKIIANSGDTPSKRSKVEMQMNPMVYFNLILLAVIAIACAIADWWLEEYYFKRGAYWEHLAIFSDDNPRINGLITFANALITFQNIVPISLYISIEFVRLAQAYFIYDDYDLYYEKTNRRTTATSWNLSDDLGQIEYIFSDKTGTLTQNMMIFREFAVDGVVYHGDPTHDDQAHLSDSPLSEKTAGTRSNQGSPLVASSSSHQSSGKRVIKPSNSEIPSFKDSNLNEALEKSDQHTEHLGDFFRCLSLCHTVLVQEHKDGSIEYQAQSPDEQALVQAAADAGFIFLGKERNLLKLQTPFSEKVEVYELLNLNEFSSARKRMSVILRRQSDGKLIIFAKGADSIMFERSASGQDDLKQKTDKALEEFANKGLRTLCLGYKHLDPEYYDTWSQRFHQATVAIKEREEQMETVASELESDFVLLGATAIEDKLQDGVPETIFELKRAGINVWVATGDKLETAIAIGYSTMLLTEDMNLIVVRGGEYGEPNSAYEQLKSAVVRFFGGKQVLEQMEHQPPDIEASHESQRPSFMLRRPSLRRGRPSRASQASFVGENNGQRQGGFALVIDGKALGHTLSEQFSKDLLLQISTQCKAVICCRVSPLQKALVVRLIRDGLGAMTLAIGDGANDVSMIQAAHVGVGIAGEEGLQAVNSSDYAIAQFRFLKRLVLVHGHWSYYRNSIMINNFFYKQIIQIGYMFWFQIYCAWSTTQAADYIYILLWNAVWTVAAVIGVGIFDRDISDKVLMQVPELYHRGRQGKYFGLKPFLLCMMDGLYQSVVLYFFVAYAYDTTSARSDGWDVSLFEWSTTMVIASVLVANLFTGLYAHAWTWWIFAAVWIGPLIIFVFAPIYSVLTPKVSWYSYGNNHFLYPSIQFWALGFLTLVLCLMPRFVLRFLRQTYYPTDVDILRYVDTNDSDHDFVNDPTMPAKRDAQHYTLATLGSSTRSSERPAMQEPLVRPGSHHNGNGLAMHELQQTASRASTHYDMLTGTERPNRGFSFSSDEPQLRKKKSRMSSLLSGSFKLRKRDDRKRLTVIPHQDDEEEQSHQ